MATKIVPIALLAMLAAGASAQSPSPSLNNDFETVMDPWFDTSNGDVNWFLEDYDKDDVSVPAPVPLAGTGILRLRKRFAGASGLAVLRAPTVTVLPGDQLFFSFWIRSRIGGFNNLEIYWLNGTREERLVSLSQFSTPNNFNWIDLSSTLPFTEPTVTTFIFYGSCGSDDLDDMALDNIRFTSTSTTQSTTPLPTTEITTEITTGAPFDCPKLLNNDERIPCAVLNLNGVNKCYCVSRYQDTWDAARTACQTGDQDLVALESADEEQIILDHINSDPQLCQSCLYWTSGTWSETGPNYIWASTNQPLTYVNWFQNQPDLNLNGACIVMNYVGQWADDQNTLRRQFVCEK